MGSQIWLGLEILVICSKKNQGQSPFFFQIWFPGSAPMCFTSSDPHRSDSSKMGTELIWHASYNPQDPCNAWYISLHENHKNQPFMQVNIPFPWMVWVSRVLFHPSETHVFLAIYFWRQGANHVTPKPRPGQPSEPLAIHGNPKNPRIPPQQQQKTQLTPIGRWVLNVLSLLHPQKLTHVH